MTIQIGQRIPEVALKRLGQGLENLNTQAVFGDRRVLLFAVPGAFSPTCSDKHFPGYVCQFSHFRQRGIEVCCMAVNDPFVLRAWGRSQGAPEGLQLLSDGNGELTRALGMELDASSVGMGWRSRRFALYADDGVVRALFVEAPGEFKVSAAEHVLAQLPVSD